MGLFNLFKKKKDTLPDETLKWNKMWDLWTKGEIESPYSELMTYQSEINNGGHSQYFCNVENTSNLQEEMSSLNRILSSELKINLQKAYDAYLSEEADDEEAEEILEKCDDLFYEKEQEINSILEGYAADIQL